MYILILLAFSLSLDAAAVGFSYGIKKIRMPFASLSVIFVVSSLMSAAGTFFGNAISHLLPAEVSKWLSFILLSLLGLWMIVGSLSDSGSETKEADKEKTFEFIFKSAGLSVKIIKHPVNCDFDNSYVIDFFEAIYLAFVLSLDAVCSCIGFGTAGGISYAAPIIIGTFQVLFLYVGDILGKYFSHIRIFNSRLSAFIPGIILIVVAVMHFL